MYILIKFYVTNNKTGACGIVQENAFAKASVYTLLNIDRGVPDVWGSLYDVGALLNATVQLSDGKQLAEMKQPLKEKMALKEALKKVEGTEVEKLLKEYWAI